MTQHPSLEARYAAFDRPVARSSPARLAVVGKLRGLETPDASRARVLEIGCGSGQNLLPMAVRHRDARFVGVDVSARSIARARRTAAEVELPNVEFRRSSVLELDSSLGTFDYIIAMDVYSCLTPAERIRLLTICRELLAPNGLAFVGYRTYPGWHVHDMLRAMMHYDSRFATNPRQQASQGRGLLEFLNTTLSGTGPFDQLLREELAPVLKQTDASLQHAYFQDANQAVFVAQFQQQARDLGLQQAGDGVLGLRLADQLSSETERRLGELTSDPVLQEQYRDVIRNRPFREAILCHADRALAAAPPRGSLGGAYLAAPLSPNEANGELMLAAVDRFATPQGWQISTAVPLIKAALQHLGQLWPLSVAHGDLVAAATAVVKAAGGDESTTAPREVERLDESLLQCCTGGIIDLDSQPPSFTTTLSARPAANPLARWQAEYAAAATNCRHELLALEYFDRYVLRLLDGTRDGQQLLAELVEWTAEGQLPIWERHQPVRNPARARQIFEMLLPESLARLLQNAFLVG